MFKNTILTVFLCTYVRCQSNKDLYNGQYGEYNKEYDPNRARSRPNPGDTDYRTYIYGDRRYGTDPTRYNPYNPNINQPGGFPYNPLPYNPLNPNPLDDQYKFNTVS